MQALELTGFGHLSVVERATPEPGPDEVRIAVTAVGICGSDLHGYTGESGRRSPGQVMGHEASGLVSAIGPSVAGLAVGTPVTFNPVIGCGRCRACDRNEEQQCAQRKVIGVTPEISAAFAEFVVVPAHNVVQLPKELPIELGALIEPLAVAAHAVTRGDLRAGESVIVVGGGPIGQSAVVSALRANAGVVGVSEFDSLRRALCGGLGAQTFDPGTAPLESQVEQGFGERADIAIDAVGSSASLAAALASIRPGGRVVLAGMEVPRLNVDAYAVSTHERSVIGSFCYPSATFRATAAWAVDYRDQLATMVTEQVPLTGAPDAFARLAAGESIPGKVLVRPSAVR